jgi:hypothetical protein
LNARIAGIVALFAGGFILLAAPLRADEKFKSTADCPDLRRLVTDLQTQYDHFQMSIALSTPVAGAALTSLARQQRAITTGLARDDETELGSAKIYRRIANQQGKGRLKLKFKAKETGAELGTEETETAAESLTAGAELRAFGFRLLKNGFMMLAADLTIKLFTGSTLPLETQLYDNPILFLQPERILGGTTSLCTCYHFEPKRMRQAEKKLLELLGARYRLGVAVSQALSDPYFLQKNLKPDLTMPADATRVERQPAFAPAAVRPAK